MSELTYDQIDLLVDQDPIALRDLAWRLLEERDKARREVAAMAQRSASVEITTLGDADRQLRCNACGQVRIEARAATQTGDGTPDDGWAEDLYDDDRLPDA